MLPENEWYTIFKQRCQIIFTDKEPFNYEPCLVLLCIMSEILVLILSQML